MAQDNRRAVNIHKGWVDDFEITQSSPKQVARMQRSGIRATFVAKESDDECAFPLKKQNSSEAILCGRCHGVDFKPKHRSAAFEGSDVALALLRFVALLPLIDECLTPSQHEVDHASEFVRGRSIGAWFIHAGAVHIELRSPEPERKPV